MINRFVWNSIGNYLRSHFYMPCDWLKINQSQAAISTYAVPPHVCAFFKLTSLFLITRNLDYWQNRLRVYVALHTRILHVHGDLEFSFFKPLNIKGPATKSTWKWKNCYQDECNTEVYRKHLFLQLFFFSFFIYFFRYKPFFQPNCCFVPFLLSRRELQ